ncbi:copper resistance D family protein [Pseudonocardia sp. H11422]|uniref:copper resistance D family protein n=1 Tax=Pseudonocardia sp. H11422 TaxID=2835866 RepID=UPI001BDCAC2F|nr:CopD family protein [Pseudonocardia sp. H11422]
MTRAAARPGPLHRLRPALWAGLAVVTAVVAGALAGALSGSAFPILVGTSVSRSGMDVAGVACVGLGLLSVLLPYGEAEYRETHNLQRRIDRALVVLAGAWLVLVLLGIVFRAADAFGRPVASLGSGEVVRWGVQLAAGRGMVLTAGCAAVVLACGVARVLRPEQIPIRVALVAALLGVLTPAVTGHASSAPDHQLAVIMVALHIGAAAVWVGGLGAMLVLVAHRRTLLGTALPRFSRLAGICVVAVAVTGVLNAQVRLPSWAALWTTGYGWLVITKTICLVVLAGLGGLARRRLAAGRSPVLRWAGTETALMAATLGVAAALTQTA